MISGKKLLLYLQCNYQVYEYDPGLDEDPCQTKSESSVLKILRCVFCYPTMDIATSTCCGNVSEARKLGSIWIWKVVKRWETICDCCFKGKIESNFCIKILREVNKGFITIIPNDYWRMLPLPRELSLSAMENNVHDSKFFFVYLVRQTGCILLRYFSTGSD